MNKSYSIMSDYTLICTDDGIRKIETPDNVSEILKQENRVEAMSNKIEEIKEQLDNLKELKENHKNKINEIFINGIVAMIITIIIMACMCINIPIKEFLV